MKIFLSILLLTFTLSASASETLELDFKCYLNNNLLKSETFKSSNGELTTVIVNEKFKFDITPRLGEFVDPLTAMEKYSFENGKYSKVSETVLITEFDKVALYEVGSEDIDTDTYRVEISLKKL